MNFDYDYDDYFEYWYSDEFFKKKQIYLELRTKMNDNLRIKMKKELNDKINETIEKLREEEENIKKQERTIIDENIINEIVKKIKKDEENINKQGENIMNQLININKEAKKKKKNIIDEIKEIIKNNNKEKNKQEDDEKAVPVSNTPRAFCELNKREMYEYNSVLHSASNCDIFDDDLHKKYNNGGDTMKRLAIMLQFARNINPLFKNRRLPVDYKLVGDIGFDMTLLVGYVQSGKTLAIQLFIGILMCQDIVPVIIVQNFIKDADQLITRMSSELRKSFMGSFKSFVYNIEHHYNIIFPNFDEFFENFSKPIFIAKFRKTISGRRNIVQNFYRDLPKPVICLANNTELDDVNKAFESLKNIKGYTVIIDECDSFYMSDMSKFKHQYDSIKANAKHVIGITATPVDCWINETKLHTSTLFKLEPPRNYKGINQIGCEFIDEKYADIREIKRNEIFSLDDDESSYPFTFSIIEIIETIISKGYWSKGYNIGVCDESEESIIMPRIGMINISPYIKHHKQMQDLLIDMNIITITTNTNGFTIYSPNHVNCSSISILKNGKEIRSTLLDNCKHNFATGKIELSDIFSFFRLNNDNTAILTIGGENLSRGLSMVCTEYKWHIDYEILIRNDNVSEWTQNVRLCGCFDDSVPLTLYTTKHIYHSVKKLNSLIDKYCIEASSAKVKQIFNEWMPSLLVQSNIVPSAKISKFMTDDLKKKLINSV